MSVSAIYVEKKPPYAVEANALLSDLRTALGVQEIASLRLVNRYFVEGLSPEDFANVRNTVFSEPQVDIVSDVFPQADGWHTIISEYLPGQFDQRADSCAQCIAISTQKEAPLVRTARIYLLKGNLSASQIQRIRAYLINPVESRETTAEVPATLNVPQPEPQDVPVLAGFVAENEEGLAKMLAEYGLAMDLDDLLFCQSYFREEEKRDPTLTELRMIDTYWSDHCRHTTFSTQLADVQIEHAGAQKTWQTYQQLRKELYAGRQKPQTLMDLATIGAKALKAQGVLTNVDESEEINACTVKIKVQEGGTDEDWLLLFKNETHNHPTEIEPFGGAATCLGGAIRDPLSGRSYVYQAMRVTGAGNPLEPASQTRAGKLPQRKIVQTAAAGYSSYGNQIGLATGLVQEIYHPGYAAKRMEIGAVVGAVPAENVVRLEPEDGDVVILLGGRTGRDGCGGATGSSKSHTTDSLESCGAEVQKGNAPEERKLQRLLRNPKATRLIKRCNDFGAGGVSVAIGELSDGLRINLDAVPKKYAGLDGTELAISESQERMAVVVCPQDAALFAQLAAEENLEATQVAVVTEQPRLCMTWRGKEIVSLARSFLNSNGAAKTTAVQIPAAKAVQSSWPAVSAKEMTQRMAELNACSQKGLAQRFDSTIGSGTVLMPFGGKHQRTPAQAMAAKIPVLEADTTTCSVMSWGFDPFITDADPYRGAMLAVVESAAKVLAAGGTLAQCWLTFQEYFPRTNNDPQRWGKPAAALLGALEAQLQLKLGAIGGKDSMSGTFEELDVPATLVSFAVSVSDTARVTSPEFKASGSGVYLLAPRYLADGTPDFEDVLRVFAVVEELTATGKAKAIWAVGAGGAAEGIANMCFGNRIGFAASKEITAQPVFGAFLVEADALPEWESSRIGTTTADYTLNLGDGAVALEEVQAAWEATLEPVFPQLVPEMDKVEAFSHTATTWKKPLTSVAKPRVLIPVFPGTNCEYDTAEAFRRAGAVPEIFVVKNLTAAAIAQSASTFAKKVSEANIIAVPGGFSGGDEPDGSGKFIVSFFRNPAITDAVRQLLNQRDGLMCGICNGFQALIKLGLVPYGDIRDMDEDCATLTFNTIGRHQSGIVQTRVASNLSPWMMHTKPDEVYSVAISHGEGRFVAPQPLLDQLVANGQIATQYVDLAGKPSGDVRFNPNQSLLAVEGITSPDGRVFGKMGHTERYAADLYANVPHTADMPIFRGAVDYFTK